MRYLTWSSFKSLQFVDIALKLLLATRNRKKMEEIQRVLLHPDLVLLSLDDFPDCPEVEEDGETFQENAMKKAREVAQYTGLTALSDDSGLIVDGLGGAPGVHSARYAGDKATDTMNVTKLLTELAALPHAPRTARFQCDLVLANPHGPMLSFTGTVEGHISPTPQGSNGFGYDPVFIPAGYTNTFAQMKAAQKDSMSHRGRALAACTLALPGFFASFSPMGANEKQA